MSSARESLFPNVRVLVDPRGRARPVRRGRTMWPENACRASDGVIHSRIFILRDEPSSVRKDILHIPQYQLNFRLLSSTAAVSTQNLDLPGFPPHPGFTRQQKSELSAHQNPCAGSSPVQYPSSALIKLLVPAHLHAGFPR